jgi:small subunit ribosomal protein S9
VVDPYTNEIVTVGRRKEATARVRLKPGVGNITVNGKSITEYLARETLVKMATEPLRAVSMDGKFDIRARCDGGGLSGQAGALRLGIARALVEHNPDFRAVLRKGGFLTRDPREVERKKYGRPGARKRFQFSKR